MVSGSEVKNELRVRGLTIYDLVGLLVEKGYLSQKAGNSNYVTVSYVLSGKRSGKKYISLLQGCAEVLGLETNK
jgi:hypothetical protein